MIRRPFATGLLAKALGMPPDQAERTVSMAGDLSIGIQPIPRAGIPDDIANTAVFLASDESSFITGQDIVVDDGQITGQRRAFFSLHRRRLSRALPTGSG